MTADWLAGSSVWGLAVRSFLPLVVTTFVALACRKTSPARLHFIWFLGLCACLVLPLTSIALPRWNLEVLPMQQPSKVVAKTSEPVRFAPQHADAQVLGTWPTVSSSKLTVDSQCQSSPLSSSTPTVSSTNASSQFTQPRIRSTFELPSVSSLFLVVWSAGTLIFGFRLILQTWSVNRLLRGGRSNEDPVWEQLLVSCRSQMEILGIVRLVFHRHETSPMVFGWVRPVIVLPESAHAWSNDKRKLVMLHELAHVKRKDLVTQMLAGVVCSLYWFNPLAWLASHQMKRLREIACDDLVVSRTTQADQYAETLLAIAKSCRGPMVAGGIAMSRSSQVGHRILCVLDTARRRNPFSTRTVMLLACLTLGFSGLFGALSLTSRAQDGKRSSSEVKESKQETDTSIRTMTIRVLDESDQPIDVAEVEVGVWEFDGKKNFPHRKLKTDERGELALPIPSRLLILRMRASQSGYVPQFLNFDQGTHEDGKNIPHTFTFHLQPGHKISGNVVDTNGIPISGVEVVVKLEFDEPIGTSIHAPVIHRELGIVTTDDQGHWELTNAPKPLAGKDYGFRLAISHPNYLGDSRGGELQNKQGITSEQIRAGTAKLTLEKGIVLTGQITDPDGVPVTKGIVIWHERPYTTYGVNECEIDSTGHYKTIHLAPGKYKITVVAPGFAPEQRQVEVSHGMTEADFQLKKGHPLKVLVMDSAGKPLPNAYVQADEWRGTEALYTHVHPSVLTSGIPSRADENGLFTWDSAPEDAVQYKISAIGYTSVKLALIAKDQPHEVQLVSPPTIFGKVTDAVTKQPIESFRVIPVKAYSPDFYSTDFQSDFVAKGEHGEYRIQFETHGQSGNRYRVRIEADGYRTALGKKDLAVGDTAVQEDFRLEPKAAWVGTVEDVNGHPVSEFKVAVGTPTTSPHFRLDRLDNNFGITFEVKGDNHFELPASFEPSLIRVFNDRGFAEVLRQTDEPIGTIRLQPWASVTGRLMQGDTPMANEGVSFHPVVRPGLTEARFQDSYFYQQTDADGYFHFDRLPPALGSFRASLGPWEDSTLTSSESIPVQLEPGKKVELLLGGGGATVHGRVIATGRNNDEFSKNWSLNYLIRRDASHAHSPKVAYSFDPSLPLSLDWTTRREFSSWLASHQNHFVKLSEDGRLKIHGVEPGDYELLVQLYEQPAGCLVETVGQKVIPLKVTESQVASGRLELGDIEVPCRIGPRPGSDMRAYKFTDVAGVGRLVDDMKDRFVLFHVWATWCGPCMASMPNLKADLEKYKEQPLTAVGLNVDEDRAKAEEVSRSSQLDWAQNYLGANSDLMRQLAVSSVPTYYLIGPDGKLIGSANTWEETKKLLEGHSTGKSKHEIELNVSAFWVGRIFRMQSIAFPAIQSGSGSRQGFRLLRLCEIHRNA